MTVIDVHTHMLSKSWYDELAINGGKYQLHTPRDRNPYITDGPARMLTVTPRMFDYEARIERMNDEGVDVSIVSLTAPNVFWGDESVSTRVARAVNDDMSGASVSYPDRIRWFASLPWEYPSMAVAELERACSLGAVGIMVLGNINGESLTAPKFEQIWAEIDRRALPVLVHPTAPPGVANLDMNELHLVGTVGFMFDTSLAVLRMILSGFFDKFPNLKIIASHAGGMLPYISGRVSHWCDTFPDMTVNMQGAPRDYLRHIYYDCLAYEISALRLCVEVGTADHVLFGSDYPHPPGDMRGSRERVAQLSEAEREKIEHANAERIFNL